MKRPNTVISNFSNVMKVISRLKALDSPLRIKPATTNLFTSPKDTCSCQLFSLLGSNRNCRVSVSPKETREKIGVSLHFCNRTLEKLSFCSASSMIIMYPRVSITFFLVAIVPFVPIKRSNFPYVQEFFPVKVEHQARDIRGNP